MYSWKKQNDCLIEQIETARQYHRHKAKLKKLQSIPLVHSLSTRALALVSPANDACKNTNEGLLSMP